MSAAKQTAAIGDATQELDVMQEIILDHNNVRDLYARYVQATTVKEKEAIGNTIIRELAVHGEAEEVSVYRRLDEEHLKSVADHSRHEHQELEEALYAFEKTSIEDQPAYDQRLKKAFQLFQQHAEEEENDVLLKLHQKLSREMDHKLATDFLAARKTVPHLPHPSAPNTGSLGHKLLGLLVTPADMSKEAARTFVELRYNHPATAITGRAMRVDPALLT